MTNPAQKGVSLAETLVATAILAAMAALIAPLISGTTKLVRRMELKLNGEEQLRTAEDTLRALFSSAILINDDNSNLGFFGDKKSVQFTSIGFGASRPIRVGISLKGQNLELSLRSLDEQGEKLNSLILFRNVTKLEFKYIGDQDQQMLEWQSNWRMNGAPNAVGVDLQIHETAHRELIFEIPATAPIFCSFDSINRRCK